MNNKKKLRMVKIFTIVSGIMAVFPLVLQGLLRLLVYYQGSQEAHSIGIIGGADGPTAIFLTTTTDWSSYIWSGLFILCTIVGVVVWKKLCK